MSNLAMNHRRLQRNDSAFYYFKKVNAFYSDNDFKMPASQAKMNLGVSYLQYQELDSASYYLKLSLKEFKAQDNKRFIAQNQSILAEVYYQKEAYKTAIELADSSLVLSQAINFKPNYSRNYSLLSRAYEKLGDTSKANEFAALEEKTMINKSPNSAVGKLNETYEAEMRDRRLSRLEEINSDKAFYKSNLFLALVLCLALLATTFIFFRKNKLTKLEVLELQNLVDNYSNSHAVQDNEVSEKDRNIVLKNKTIVSPKDILYVKSDGHYVEYNLSDKDKPEVERNSLTQVLDELPQLKFTRIRRSYIINIEHIKIINSTQIMLDTGEWIPLSRTYKPGLKDLLNKT